jgi:hypothetical protein
LRSEGKKDRDRQDSGDRGKSKRLWACRTKTEKCGVGTDCSDVRMQGGSSPPPQSCLVHRLLQRWGWLSIPCPALNFLGGGGSVGITSATETVCRDLPEQVQRGGASGDRDSGSACLQGECNNPGIQDPAWPHPSARMCPGGNGFRSSQSVSVCSQVATYLWKVREEPLCVLSTLGGSYQVGGTQVA